MATLHNSRHQDDLAVTRSNLGSMEPGTFDIRAIWEQLNALRSYLATVDTYYPPVHLTPESNSQADLERYYHQPQNLIGGRCCTDPWRAMMVKTDGSVIPSHGRCYNFRVGSITETDLPTIWNSDRFLQFRRLLTVSEFQSSELFSETALSSQPGCPETAFYGLGRRHEVPT